MRGFRNVWCYAADGQFVIGYSVRSMDEAAKFAREWNEDPSRKAPAIEYLREDGEDEREPLAA